MGCEGFGDTEPDAGGTAGYDDDLVVEGRYGVWSAGHGLRGWLEERWVEFGFEVGWFKRGMIGLERACQPFLRAVGNFLRAVGEIVVIFWSSEEPQMGESRSQRGGSLGMGGVRREGSEASRRFLEFFSPFPLIKFPVAR